MLAYVVFAYAYNDAFHDISRIPTTAEKQLAKLLTLSSEHCHEELQCKKQQNGRECEFYKHTHQTAY